MKAEYNMISLGSRIDTITEKLEKNKKIKLIEIKKDENENEIENENEKIESKEVWNNGKPSMVCTYICTCLYIYINTYI
jgi:hypothetical protein